jgi:glycosyltransferase involved in cell wall biosynthesis
MGRPLSNSPLFVSWMEYHGRSEGLARKLGATSLYFGSTRGAAVRYLRYSVSTFVELLRRRPTAVLVMQPPIVALFPVLIYSWIFSARIAADLHTGVFYDPKWRWGARLTLRLLRRRDIAIVTNEHLAALCRGGRAQVLVLHDLIEDLESEPRQELCDDLLEKLRHAAYALVPVCYEYDEPIEEVLEAARRTPAVQFVLTGRPPADLPARAPANVVFTGYVSNEEYWSLVVGAGCILALTIEEDTMQRAGYEALCFGKSAVVSPTVVLREYFGDAVCYASPEAESIAQATTKAIQEREKFQNRARSLRESYIEDQASALKVLRIWLLGSVGRTDEESHRTPRERAVPTASSEAAS